MISRGRPRPRGELDPGLLAEGQRARERLLDVVDPAGELGRRLVRRQFLPERAQRGRVRELLVSVERHPVIPTCLPFEHVADPLEPSDVRVSVAANLHLEPTQAVPPDAGLEAGR